ncbi:MAG TPA: hypothetical protein VKJ65_12850, partial [Phycisphaerae bacterium]|nr:hypothetical protein [Phycisphaerae bacterium]
TAGSNRRASEPTTSSGAFSRSPRPRAPAVPQPMVRPGQNRGGTGATSDDVDQPQGLRANRSLYLLFIFLIGVIFCVAAAVIVHELSPKHTITIVPYSPTNLGNNNEANANNNAPKFLGIPMVGAHVVFAIDGSAANADTYSLIVQNAQYAVKHGLSSTHYRVLIWDNGGGVTVPSHGWIRKSTAATQWTPAVNYAPTGNSDPLETILHSSKLGGDQIILVTARTDIPSQLATQVNDLQIPSRIDAISVNTPSTILAQIADQHRGIYEQVSTVDLQNALTGQN